MRDEPILTDRARDALAVGAPTVLGVMGVLVLFFTVLSMVVLVRLAPLIVVAFVAIVLAKCSGVI